jgi:hypothetical protein
MYIYLYIFKHRNNVKHKRNVCFLNVSTRERKNHEILADKKSLIMLTICHGIQIFSHKQKNLNHVKICHIEIGSSVT